MATTPPRLPQLQGLTPLRFSPYKNASRPMGSSPRSKRLSTYTNRQNNDTVKYMVSSESVESFSSIVSGANSVLSERSSSKITFESLFVELKKSEVAYHEELQLLIQSELSDKMTKIVRRLKLLHDNMPQDVGFFAWSRDIYPLYSAYITEYTYSATSSMHILYLLKRPLVRIRYLAKVLKKLAQLSPEIQTRIEIAETFRKLVTTARDKAESERQRVDLTTFNFDNVVSFDTLQTVDYEFDYRHALHRDYFELQVKHRSGKTFEKQMVEVFLVTDNVTPNKGLPSKVSGDAFCETFESLAICSLDEPGRSLIFPNFRKGDMVLVQQPQSRFSSKTAKYELVLQASNHSTVVLYCPEIDQIRLWSRVLTHLFGNVTDYSASKANSDLLKLTFGTEYSFGTDSSKILTGKGGLNISHPELAKLNAAKKETKSIPKSLSLGGDLGESLFGGSLDKFKEKDSPMLDFSKPIEKLNIVKKDSDRSLSSRKEEGSDEEVTSKILTPPTAAAPLPPTEGASITTSSSAASIPPVPTVAPPAVPAPPKPSGPSFARAAAMVASVPMTGPAMEVSSSMESFQSEIMDRGSSNSSWSEMESEELQVEDPIESKPLLGGVDHDMSLPVLKPMDTVTPGDIGSPASTVRPNSEAFMTADDTTPHSPNFPRPRENGSAIASRRLLAAPASLFTDPSRPHAPVPTKSQSVIGAGSSYEDMVPYTANTTASTLQPLQLNSTAMLRTKHKFVPPQGTQSRFSPELEPKSKLSWFKRKGKKEDSSAKEEKLRQKEEQKEAIRLEKERKKAEKEQKRLEKEEVKERERHFHDSLKREREEARKAHEMVLANSGSYGGSAISVASGPGSGSIGGSNDSPLLPPSMAAAQSGTSSNPSSARISAISAFKTVSSKLVKPKPMATEPTFQMIDPPSKDMPVVEVSESDSDFYTETDEEDEDMESSRHHSTLLPPIQTSTQPKHPQVMQQPNLAQPLPTLTQSQPPSYSSLRSLSLGHGPSSVPATTAAASAPSLAPPVIIAPIPTAPILHLDNSSNSTITLSPAKRQAPPPPPSRRPSRSNADAIKTDLQQMSRSLNQSLVESASNSTIASLASEELERSTTIGRGSNSATEGLLDAPSITHHLRAARSMESLPSTISSKSIASMGREDSGFSFLEPGFFEESDDEDDVEVLDTPEIEQLEIQNVKAKAVMVSKQLPSEPSDGSISSKRSVASTSSNGSGTSIKFMPLRNAKSEELLSKKVGSSASVSSTQSSILSSVKYTSESDIASEAEDTLAPLVKIRPQSRSNSPAAGAAPTTTSAGPVTAAPVAVSSVTAAVSGSTASSILSIHAFTSRWKGNSWETVADTMVAVRVSISSEGGKLDICMASSTLTVNLNKQAALRRGTAVDVQLRQSTDIYSFRLRNSREADALLSACNSAKKDLVEQPLMNTNRGSMYAASTCSDSSLGTVSSSAMPLSLKPRNKLSLLAQDDGLLLLQNLKSRLFLSPRMSKLWLGLGTALISVTVSTEDLMTSSKTVTMKQEGFGEAVFSGSLPPQAFAKDGSGIRVYADYEKLGEEAIRQRDLSSNVYFLQLKGEKEVDRVFEILTTS